MRYAWLVLAALAVASGEGQAKSVSCTCPGPFTLPERGATGLPTNAKVWIVDAHSYIQRLEPKLEPNSTFTDDVHGIAFTTGADADTTAPDAPRDISVGIAVDAKTRRLISLSAWGNYPSDAAFIRIHVQDSAGSFELVTTPRALFLCQSHARIAPGMARVTITAVDIAGNESIPFVTRIEPTQAFAPAEELDGCGNNGVYRRRHGHGFEILFYMFVYVVVLVSWVIVTLIRRIVARRSLAEPMTLLEGEELVRRLMRWQVAWSAMLIVSMIALLNVHQEDAQLLGMGLAPFALLSLARLFFQRRAQSLLGRADATAVRHGRWLDVTSSVDSVLLRASDMDFVMARRRSIPTSVAH